MNRSLPVPCLLALLALLPVLLALAACKRPADEAAASLPKAPVTASPPAAVPEKTPAAPAALPQQPALQVTTLDGKRYDLSAHRGKWVVVNFWATWCGPCLKEMPELSALDAMREHIEVIGLAYEDIASAELRAFLQKHPVAYPVAIVDVYDPPKDFATPRGLPTTYLIAPDGRVARQFLGPVTAQEIEQVIAGASAPPAPAPG